MMRVFRLSASVVPSSSDLDWGAQHARYRHYSWWLVLVTQLANASIASLMTGMNYLALTLENGVYAENSGIFVIAPIPVVYAVVALFYWLACLRTLLAFTRRRHVRSVRLPGLAITHKMTKLLERAVEQCSGRCGFQAGLPSFELSHLVTSILQSLVETYQLYRCSILLSQVWFNHFYVLLFVANCWGITAIHFRTKRHNFQQRLLYLWSDVLLDAVAILVVPLIIIVSLLVSILLPTLHSTVASNAFVVRTRDAQFMNLVMGGKQIMATSPVDFLAKIFPFFSTAICLVHIQHVLDEAERTPQSPRRKNSGTAWSRAVRRISTIRQNAPTIRLLRIEARANRVTMQCTSIAPSLSSCRNPIRECHPEPPSRAARVLVSAFALWGLAVLGIHIAAVAVSKAAPSSLTVSCELSNRPWFAWQYSCTTLQINCHRRNISGTADELDQALASYYAPGMLDLIISHCPLVTIPKRLQTLSNLFNMEIYNSTLVEWSAAAALTRVTNPNIRTVIFLRVNMTGIPDGIQASHPPPALHRFHFAGINVTTWPSDLHTKWPVVNALNIERSPLAEFPETIAKMHVPRLSLMNNRIEHIPDQLLADNAFLIVSLAGNPLRQWPATIGDTTQLLTVLMDNTLVDTLPAWMQEEGAKRAKQARSLVVSAGGSAYCDARRWNEPGHAVAAGVLLDCRAKAEGEIEGSQYTFIGVDRAW